MILPDEEFFDLRIKVHQALQSLRSEDYFSSLMRTSEGIDPDFDNVSVWEIDYSTRFADNSARGSLTPVVSTLKPIVVNP